MKKTNNSYTLTLCVDYALIDTGCTSVDTLPLAHDDIYATDWLHQQGYKARIEGNTLIIAKDNEWVQIENRYVIIPNVEYHNYKENRNYGAITAVAKRFAIAHTIAIVRKINAGH